MGIYSTSLYVIRIIGIYLEEEQKLFNYKYYSSFSSSTLEVKQGLGTETDASCKLHFREKYCGIDTLMMLCRQRLLDQMHYSLKFVCLDKSTFMTSCILICMQTSIILCLCVFILCLQVLKSIFTEVAPKQLQFSHSF